MKIRPYKPADAAYIASLFQRSVMELGRLFYTDEQVKAWAARGPTLESVQSRNNDGRRTLVAASKEDKILAYAELETDGHIDQVYALPEVAGTGVVSTLYDEIEKIAFELGIETLYTEASEGALRFFVKKNFMIRSRVDFDIEGISIHNYKMDKFLKR
jgi:putative acetyltransferase